MKRYTYTVPKDGIVILPAHLNHKLEDITVTGVSEVKLSNSNYGHIHTSKQEPHKFPVLLLSYPPNASSFHDLIFETTPGAVLDITWKETHIPYAHQTDKMKYNRSCRFIEASL